MTILGTLMEFFPFLHATSLFICGGLAFFFLGNAQYNLTYLAVACLLFLFNLYILPPLFFRLHNRVFILKSGFSDFSKHVYSPWWGGHQIQKIYISLPFLESLLRLIPGLYSGWLRLWGAKIGKCIYWTPNVEIVDRSLIELGDYVVFGHRSAICSHVITPRKGGLLLYVGPIVIGDGVFVGAEAKIGPGARIDQGVFLPYGTVVSVNSHVKASIA